jgi:protein-tyrosine phosphatase
MREIIPRLLWVANSVEGRDIARLLETEIAALVDLTAEEFPPSLTREMVYCRFPLIDGAGNPPLMIKAAIEATAGLVRNEMPTLVYCSAGMSRAPSIVAAALADLRREPLDDCLRLVTSDQPHDVSPGLWREIKEICRQG